MVVQPVLRLRGTSADENGSDFLGLNNTSSTHDSIQSSLEQWTSRSGNLRAATHELPRLDFLPRENQLVRQQSQADTDLAHARLLSRLSAWGLRERPVKGDGNCQFRAVADQLWGDEAQHALVRQMAVEQLAEEPEEYRDFILGSSFEEYLEMMAADCSWGDHVTLQALADRLRVEIALVTSFEEAAEGDAVILVSPRALAGTSRQRVDGEEAGPASSLPLLRTLWLSFFAEIHYQSIEPATDQTGDRRA